MFVHTDVLTHRNFAQRCFYTEKTYENCLHEVLTHKCRFYTQVSGAFIHRCVYTQALFRKLNFDTQKVLTHRTYAAALFYTRRFLEAEHENDEEAKEKHDGDNKNGDDDWQPLFGRNPSQERSGTSSSLKPNVRKWVPPVGCIRL